MIDKCLFCDSSLEHRWVSSSIHSMRNFRSQLQCHKEDHHFIWDLDADPMNEQGNGPWYVTFGLYFILKNEEGVNTAGPFFLLNGKCSWFCRAINSSDHIEFPVETTEIGMRNLIKSVHSNLLFY